jgi:hypothetical protein
LVLLQRQGLDGHDVRRRRHPLDYIDHSVTDLERDLRPCVSFAIQFRSDPAESADGGVGQRRRRLWLVAEAAGQFVQQAQRALSGGEAGNGDFLLGSAEVDPP